MEADDVRMPTLICPDRLNRATLCGAGWNRHRLGGPLELDIKGWPRRTPLPHRVLTLRLTDPALGLDTQPYWPIPLIYGLRISGSRLAYQVTGGAQIEIQDFRGKPSKDWPYAGYPETLPTVPLYFGTAEPIDWMELEKHEDWHGLTHQDSRPGANEVLVVVPPNDAYGDFLVGLVGGPGAGADPVPGQPEFTHRRGVE